MTKAQLRREIFYQGNEKAGEIAFEEVTFRHLRRNNMIYFTYLYKQIVRAEYEASMACTHSDKLEALRELSYNQSLITYTSISADNYLEEYIATHNL